MEFVKFNRKASKQEALSNQDPNTIYFVKEGLDGYIIMNGIKYGPAGYLPLTGGTISGDLKADKIEATDIIHSNQDITCGGTKDQPEHRLSTKVDVEDLETLNSANAQHEQRISTLENSKILLTEEEYDNLQEKDPNVFYYIYEE